MPKTIDRKSRARRPVLGMPRARAQAPAGGKQPPLLLAARTSTVRSADDAIQTGTQADAVAKLLAGSGAGGSGRCLLILGNAQYGKTTFALKVAQAMLDQGMTEAVLVHDCKYPDHAQYDGRAVTSEEEARRVYFDEAPDWLVLRPEVTPEQGAQVVKDSTLAGVKATLLVDEIMASLKTNDEGAPIPKAFSGGGLVWIPIQGGGPGASCILLAQTALWVPQCFSANSTVVAFSTGGLSLNNALDQGLIPREASAVVSNLAVGQCLIFPRGFNWDRTIYGPK